MNLLRSARLELRTVGRLEAVAEYFMIGPFYTDQQVAARIDPTGRLITARSIRTERDQGRLVGTRIAGKWLYAEADIGDWLAGARVLGCRAESSEHAPNPISAPALPRSFTRCDGHGTDSGESTASVLAGLKKRGNASWRRKAIDRE